MSKLKNKEDELRKLNKEFEALQKNFNNMNSLSNVDSSTIVPDSKKNVVHHWNHQLLQNLLNDNKTTPAEVSTRLTPVIDNKSNYSRIKVTINFLYHFMFFQQISNRLPPTDKTKHERSSVTPGNTSFVNTSSSNLKKDNSDK